MVHGKHRDPPGDNEGKRGINYELPLLAHWIRKSKEAIIEMKKESKDPITIRLLGPNLPKAFDTSI